MGQGQGSLPVLHSNVAPSVILWVSPGPSEARMVVAGEECYFLYPSNLSLIQDQSPSLLRIPPCSQESPSTACPGCLAACPFLFLQAAFPC